MKFYFFQFSIDVGPDDPIEKIKKMIKVKTEI